MIRAMSKEVKDYEVVILVADTLHEEMNGLFELLSQEKNIILSYLGDEKFDHFDVISQYFSAIIYSPNKSSKEYDLTSQIIFGGYPAQNTLSKNLNDTLKKGFGLTTEKIRLSYGKPKDLDITGFTFEKTGETEEYQVMENQKLVPLLTAALQEAIAKKEALEARVTTLEGKT